MTKEEIKKALECCNSTGSYVCDDCPYYYDDGCRDKLIDAALNLITEQEKENEKLEQLNAIQCDAWQKLSDENESLAMENSSNFRYNSVLRKENNKLKAEIKQLKAEVKQAQIDVLNKAKEKFNAISRELGDECDLCGVTAVCSCICEIDDLIEEV